MSAPQIMSFTQPLAALQMSLVHGSPSMHSSLSGSCVQASRASLHASSVQLTPSPQILGVPEHDPLLHWSGSVQNSPSLQAVPSGSDMLGGHVPAPSQFSCASHWPDEAR